MKVDTLAYKRQAKHFKFVAENIAHVRHTRECRSKLRHNV